MKAIRPMIDTRTPEERIAAALEELARLSPWLLVLLTAITVAVMFK